MLVLHERQLFDGAFETGQWVTIQTSATCVCVEHTYDNFPNLNWWERRHVARCCAGASAEGDIAASLLTRPFG